VPETTPASEKQRWEETTLKKALDRFPERRTSFTNLSNNEVGRLYTQEDLDRIGFDYEKDLGYPGEFPYTRGVQPTMYRGRFWTMRQFAGFGTARETNERFKYLLSQGQTGLSTAFDFPTLQGFDSDHEWALGEVGKVGVAIDTQQDMETLFSGINLADVSVSMTINGPAPMIWAFYLGAAEKQGVPMDQLRGTIQNDILKEYQAQKMFIFPPEPSIELVLDTFEYGAHNTPLFNPVSISGYHIREAGSTAVQELAFTLANGMDFVRRGIARGMDPDTFAPRLSFFFNAHNDFFEEIAKFRAARRIWARFMRNDIGAKNPKSWLLRFHTQTAGMTCTREQPENNIVRVGLQALAAVLGGTQSLHTNSFDEAFALPTEKAVRIALRTQQIIAEESGVTNTMDPLGGSYYLETLTSEMEDKANDYFERIEKIGGIVRGIERGFFQREIADAAYQYQRSVEDKDRIIVGVNKHRMEEEPYKDTLKIDAEGEQRQLDELAALRNSRDATLVETSLNRLTEGCEAAERPNLMPLLVDASRAYCSLGEMREAMVKVYGEYREPAVF
jgi:methylmalonyl-CoA mutase N-terminal domain/subunit